MTSADYQVQQLQLRVRDLETRMLQLEDRVVFDLQPERKPAPVQQEFVCDKDPQGCWNVRCQLGKVCKNTPPQRTWIGLTDEEITEVWRELKSKNEAWSDLDFARAIEAKLKEKNA